MITAALLLAGTLSLAGSAEDRTVPQNEEEALRAFRQWAEEIAAVPSIHFRFRSTWTQGPIEGIIDGTVDLDGANGSVYLETTESSLKGPRSGARVHRYATWHAGVGHVLVVDPGEVRQRALRPRGPRNVEEARLEIPRRLPAPGGARDSLRGPSELGSLESGSTTPALREGHGTGRRRTSRGCGRRTDATVR